MKQITYLFVVLSLLASSIYTSEVVHKFKSPSFSGISTSSHYLTIENQQKSRRDKIADDLESAIAAAERDADGTTQAKFLRNLESRIYAQISKQLVDKMFGTEEVDASLEGFFDLMGNSISYEVCTGCGVDGVAGSVEGLTNIMKGLESRVRQMNNDMIKIDLIVSESLELRPDVDRVARAENFMEDGKIDARRD